MKKSTLLVVFVLASYFTYGQNGIGYMRASNAITSVYGSAVSAPMPSLYFSAGVLSENGLFAEAIIGDQTFQYSHSTYRMSLLGAALGYQLDLRSFGLRLAANADVRIGGQQEYQGVPYGLSVNPLDISLHPQVFTVLFDGTSQIDLSFGYKMGLLNLDGSDLIPNKIGAFTMSIGLSFGEVQLTDYSSQTLSP
jgi:hypothetical protein